MDSHPQVLEKYRNLLKEMDPLRPMGRVHQVTGLSITSEGPPDVRVGDICRVELTNADHLPCEVVGFQGHRLVLMPLGSTTGVFPNASVLATGRRLSVPVGDALLGRVLDGLGRPLDAKSPLVGLESRPLDVDPPSPTLRTPIREPLITGVRSIDGLLTAGRGQRLGLFAGTGVGKSTLLGMIARYTKADVNVIALVGERGREVLEFIQNDLGPEGLAKSVLFVATSDRSAMEKVYAAGFATSAAEYFRERGMSVNLLFDSVTRYCWALREVGLMSGEQIGTGGYPPGVWLRLARLVERCGSIASGSITGFYTVLVEADDMNEPVADNTRGILDGHIVLSRKLANKGHYPAVEVTESVSRVMDRVTQPGHKADAQRLKEILFAYREAEELINLGAYARGSNPLIDEAIEKLPAINRFLRQPVEDGSSFADTVEALHALVSAGEEEAFY